MNAVGLWLLPHDIFVRYGSSAEVLFITMTHSAVINTV